MVTTAFIQHMIHSLNPEGKIGVVVPMGVLFRGGRTAHQKKIVDEDLIETIIGLGPNLFYGASIPAALIILKSEASPDEEQNLICQCRNRGRNADTCEKIEKLSMLSLHIKMNLYLAES